MTSEYSWSTVWAKNSHPLFLVQMYAICADAGKQEWTHVEVRIGSEIPQFDCKHSTLTPLAIFVLSENPSMEWFLSVSWYTGATGMKRSGRGMNFIENDYTLLFNL